jgi:AcrR family transcriptional regulator
VSVVAIARMAGVAKPLVQYHYAFKDRLWDIAVEEIHINNASSTPQAINNF